MLAGKMPAGPHLGYHIVDVRDLIDLHLRAMTHPDAAGQRLIAAGDFLWFSDIARILRENLGKAGRRAPKRTLPDWIIRIGARFNPEMAQMAPNLGIHSRIKTDKTEELLGWRTRSAQTSILDAAKSLIDRQLI